MADGEVIQECSSLQAEEWEVLESIYPDCVSTDTFRGIKKLEVPVDLGDSTSVIVADNGATSAGPLGETLRKATQSLSLGSLPPVLLELLLPPTYPLSSPPLIISLSVATSWLLRVDMLQCKLLEMWQPGEGVLYAWVDWIQSVEFLHSLDHFSNEGGRETLKILHPAPHLLAPLLINYDATSKSSKFSQNSYECTVCLSYQKGARCLMLLCGHIFCRSCLEDGWKLYIAEGSVDKVGCLHPDCVKEGREATEEEVRRVADEDELRRWKWLREKRILDRDPTIIHCPVSLCQTPVPKPKGTGDQDSGWERLRICQSCGYSFCGFCKRTWHGPLSDCPIPVADGFLAEYMAMAEGSPARKALEQRYGLKNLTRMVAKFEEDKANREWLQKSTMACPRCNLHVEKSSGCNHMTCAQCRQHFCYVCGIRLNPRDPYPHFSTPGQGCYMKLFDAVAGSEDEWEPIEGIDIGML